MRNTLDEPMVRSVGVYDFTEAARYLKAARHGAALYPRTPRTIAGWFRRWANDGGLRESRANEPTVTFNDLISMRLVGALRVSGVAWPEIYKVIKWLRDQTETQHPLASRDIWSDENWVDDICNLLYPVTGASNLTGPDFGELALEYVLPEHGLTFDEKSGRVTSWEIDNGIVLHPLVQFGAPCIKGTRIPVYAIAGMVKGGDSALSVAEDFQLPIEKVQTACDFEHRAHGY